MVKGLQFWHAKFSCDVWDLVPWPGIKPGPPALPRGGHGNPLQYSCLENPYGQRSLVGYSPRGLRVRRNWATKHSTHHILCHNNITVSIKRGIINSINDQLQILLLILLHCFVHLLNITTASFINSPVSHHYFLSIFTSINLVQVSYLASYNYELFRTLFGILA